jgi:cyclic pyranopterin monophosphate synthase
MELTHFDDSGRARMVDVGDKAVTQRWAVARGEIRMSQATLDRIRAGRIAKGDVLGVAQVAGIMAAKDAARLIPMCHPLLLDGVEMEFATVDADEGASVLIEARVRTTGRTGAEMEALTAVAAAGLTIYDMCKAIDRGMVVGQIRLIEKEGGKSGHYVRPGEGGR